MAFDPTTATLLEDEPDTGFDPASATLVEEDSVEPDVPRGTPVVPQAPKASRADARNDLTKRLQDSGLFGSATAALQGAPDKGIRRREDGDWDLPNLLTSDGGVIDALQGGLVSFSQKMGDRLPPPERAKGRSEEIKTIQKTFHDFQQANNLSDDEVNAAWSDLGNLNRTWGKDENLRILSDGELLPNPGSSVWLNPAEAKKAIEATDTPDSIKAAALSQIPQLAAEIAAQKTSAYEAAAEASNTGQKTGALGALQLFADRVVPPSEWAKENGRTDVGSPQFVLDYERAVDPGFLEGIAGKLVLSGNKLATQTLGTLGVLGVDAAGDLAAEGSAGAAAVNQGLPDTGLAGAAVEELLPIGAQILTGRGFAAFGKTAAALGTFATAGAQSAGLTFAEQRANGATEEVAREKAVKAGLSTAIITSMFGTGAGGGVERFAAGQAADEVTVGALLQMARDRGLKEVAKSPELRKFAGTVAASTIGEGAEEGIDQLLGAFLQADPETPLADAWEQATQAFKVGAAIGGGVDVAMNIVQHAPMTAAALAEEPFEPVEIVADEDSPLDALEGGSAGTGVDVEMSSGARIDSPATPPDNGAPAPLESAPVEEDPEAGAFEPIAPEPVIQAENPAAGDIEPITPPTGEIGPVDPAIGDVREPVAGGQNQGQIAPLNAAETAQPVGAAWDINADPTSYSRDRLKETFDLTDEQADATDALVKSMGLDTARIRLTKGGTPGKGLSMESGTSVPQGIKGSFEVLANGDMLLRGLTHPDVSTGLHELSHVARRTLFDKSAPVAGITPEDITVAEKWAGAKNGKWGRDAEEKFARGFERYLRDGEAPNQRLAAIFDKVSNWLKGIYQSLSGSPINVRVTPQMRAVFDKLVNRNPDAGDLNTAEAIPQRAPTETPSATEEPVLSEAGTAPPSETTPPVPGQPESQESPENLTSVKNAATDAELEDFGFDPIAAPAQKALQTSWDQALARLERDPRAGVKLVTELNSKPRATDDVEHGVLLKELADAKVAYGNAQQNLTNAESGGTPPEIEIARREADLARDYVYSVITAAKATGTVWGRAGRFRQLAIDEDYSLVQMEAQYRTEVNEGKPLTPEQVAEVKDLHDQIAKHKAELDAYKAKAAEDLARAVHAATLAALKKAKPQIRKALGSKIEGAKKRLRELGMLQEDGPDFLAQEALPENVVNDLATVAAGWMVDGDPSAKDFADRLKRMFGDRAAAQAEDVRARAREILNDTIDETFNPAADVEDGQTVSRGRRPKTVEEVMADLDPAEAISGNDVFQLARLHLNNGVEGFEIVMNAVLGDLKSTYPDLTLREVHDAYSGYGRTIFPSKAEDLAKLREYRTLARLTSQLEDASKGEAPKRTGMQRDKSSERVRTLQKQVREMMRKMGINEVSDDQRLKSSLDAVKTRLKNEIEELEVSLRDRAPRPETKSQVSYDAEAKGLKARRDALREEYQSIFGKKGLSDEDRIKQTVKALERRIEETEKLIAQGKAKRDRATGPKVTSPEIEALRTKLGGLNEQRNALRDREAERLERTKKITRGRIEKTMARIRKGDYEPAAKLPPVKPDPELGRLQRLDIETKRLFNNKLLEAQLARRSAARKVFDTGIEVANAARSLVTSADVSAVLRQGGFIAFGNPVRALKAIGPMFRAGFSANYAEGLAEKIRENDKFVLSQKAKLFLSEFGDTHNFTKQEEAFRGRLIKQVPYVRRVIEFSERTYTAFLNKLRMDTFESMVNAISPTGEVTPEEAKVIANYVNIATGRGNLEQYENASAVLAAAFFSPKYVVSRFQLLAMPLTGFRAGKGATMRTRKAIATEYAKTLGGLAVLYAMTGLAKAFLDDEDDEKVTIEHDPRSSDFGKIKIGNTRIDPLFGLAQATVLLARINSGQTKNRKGEIVDLRGDGKPAFGSSVVDVMKDFARSKLAPVPSTIINLYQGEDVVGNKVFWETELAGNLMPLSTGDIYATMKEQGIPAGTALSILSLFGAGMNTYGDDEPPFEQEIMTKVFGVDPARYE